MSDILWGNHLWHLDELFPHLTGDPTPFVNECCNEYKKRIDTVAASIADNPNHKILMLSGPSGSGKTTTARFLQDALAKRNIRSFVVSLDNFYLGNGRAPKLPNGDFDYESVHALDVPALTSCLQSLIEKGSCLLPEFDFHASKPKEEKIPIQLCPGDLIIFEGIHALNPLLLECLPSQFVTKIYVSVETTVYGCHNVVIPPREIRLARRMVRDSIYRNSDALRTLQFWTGVMNGEDQYLLPYRDDVDYVISTFHEFEPAILKPYLIPLLKTVTPDYPNYDLAIDLLDDYRMFPTLEPTVLPNDCLIHEFID